MFVQPSMHVPASELENGVLHKDPLLCTPPPKSLIWHSPKVCFRFSQEPPSPSRAVKP